MRALESEKVDHHKVADDICKLKQKFVAKMKGEMDRLTSNKMWMFSWLYIDLHEWEVAEQLKFGLEPRSLLGKMQNLKERVLKIREQLAYLQTQTVISYF